MKYLAALLALTVTSAIADDATVTLPADSVRALIDENTALRKEVNKLDKENDKLYAKWRKRVLQRGECT